MGVVCQPDRPRGRGMKLSPCPVKALALELGLEVHQPVAVKKGDLHEWLKARQVQAAIVMAYGRILPPPVLDAPEYGCINLHASLLPKYRGAAPINWVLMNGESETGICLMRMDVGLDTGPVFSERRLAIRPGTTAGELTERLGALGEVVIREDLPAVFAGQRPTPQDDSQATHAPPLVGADCVLDWSKPAVALANQVMGLSPKPGAFTTMDGKRLKILRAEPANVDNPTPPPGRIVVAQGNNLIVSSGDGYLRVLEAQLPGKRALAARDLVNGRALVEGMLLGSDG